MHCPLPLPSPPVSLWEIKAVPSKQLSARLYLPPRAGTSHSPLSRKHHTNLEEAMKKATVLILFFMMIMWIVACSTPHAVNTPAATEVPETSEPSSIPTKTRIQQIEEQLQGSWKSIDSKTVYSIWTFNNGRYVVDTYVNGQKISNSIVGVYTIGTDAIHTVTIDQEKNVEGQIPYSFENGKLVLDPKGNGTINKEE